MVMQTPDSNTAPRTPVSLEQAISHAIGEMRTAAATANRDDYWGNWTADVLDRRPRIFVAAVMEGQTLAWLMTPDDDGVLHATVGRHSADAELVFKTRALGAIADDVSWSVKEATGLHFHESRALHTGD
jgi:hypothetical protein